MAREIAENTYGTRLVTPILDPALDYGVRNGAFLADAEPEIEIAVADDAGRADDEQLLDVDQAIELAFRAATKPLSARELSGSLRSVVIVRDGEPRWRRKDVLRFLQANELL